MSIRGVLRSRADGISVAVQKQESQLCPQAVGAPDAFLPRQTNTSTNVAAAAIAAQVEGSGMAEKLLRLSLKKSSPALFNMKPPTKDDKPVPGSISNKFNTELAVPLPKLPSVGVDPLLK